MSTATAYRDQAPADVVFLLGSGHDVVTAMVKAERYGAARVGNVTVIHTGYQRDTSEYNAATAIYRVTL